MMARRSYVERYSDEHKQEMNNMKEHEILGCRVIGVFMDGNEILRMTIERQDGVTYSLLRSENGLAAYEVV